MAASWAGEGENQGVRAIFIPWKMPLKNVYYCPQVLNMWYHRSNHTRGVATNLINAMSNQSMRIH